MADAGIFGEDDRLELLQGEIIEMTPIGPRHASCVTTLTTQLGKRIGDGARLSVQNPVQLDDETELYPDIALLKPRADSYRHRMPQAQDVLLLIEVADSTFKADQSIKIPRYARSGIAEVWLVDVAGRRVFVHTDPKPSGYEIMRQVSTGELQASQLPVAISLDEVF